MVLQPQGGPETDWERNSRVDTYSLRLLLRYERANDTKDDTQESESVRWVAIGKGQ